MKLFALSSDVNYLEFIRLLDEQQRKHQEEKTKRREVEVLNEALKKR